MNRRRKVKNEKGIKLGSSSGLLLIIFDMCARFFSVRTVRHMQLIGLGEDPRLVERHYFINCDALFDVV